MIIFDPQDMRMFNRMSQQYDRFYGCMRAFRKAEPETSEDTALDGWAILYDQPLLYDREIWVFEAGCFSRSLNSGLEIHFQLDHDDNQRVASTRNAVNFADNEVGLAFRLNLSKVQRGAELKRMVESNHRAAISVGIKNEATHIKMFGEHPVRMITKADLIEVSLVAAGKCANAFAGLVDTGIEALDPGKKGVMFTANFAAHKMKRVKKTSDERRAAIDSIAATLDRLEGKRSIAPTDTKAETPALRWYRNRSANIADESPAVAKWYKTWSAA
jgi:HK97 family phage prohead protease